MVGKKKEKENLTGSQKSQGRKENQSMDCNGSLKRHSKRNQKKREEVGQAPQISVQTWLLDSCGPPKGNALLPHGVAHLREEVNKKWSGGCPAGRDSFL